MPAMLIRPVLSFLIGYAACLSGAGVTFEDLPGRMEIKLDGKQLTTFHYDSKWDKPFLYPIRTASGEVISRGWPIEPRAGETEDHAWHRGFWWAHGDINGDDFWREKPHPSTSRTVIDGKPAAKGDALEVKLGLIGTRAGRRLGTVVERYAFRRDGANILIDTTITVHADGGQALRFGDSDDGGFAFRLSDEFREDRGAKLTNSAGQSGTKEIWGKPAKWVHYSAKVNGKPAGVAVLDHPSNLRHPSRWHARGYSLNSANPFALGSFTEDKKNDGSYTLPAGKQLRFRYLVVIHEGDLSPDGIEQYFVKFSRP